MVFIYNVSHGLRLTRATKRYKLVSNEPITTGFIKGAPTSVSGLTVQLVTKLSEGPTLADPGGGHGEGNGLLGVPS